VTNKNTPAVQCRMGSNNSMSECDDASLVLVSDREANVNNESRCDAGGCGRDTARCM